MQEPARAKTSASALPRPQESGRASTKGKVVEVLRGGGYTYLSIESDGQKRWAAMPPTEVNVGQDVELQPGIEMQNFKSKALGRTFDRITFCNGLLKKGGEAPVQSGVSAPKTSAPAPHDAAASGMPSGHPALPSDPGACESKPAGNSPVGGKIVETMNGGSYTYAALEKDGRRTWVAVPSMKLQVGQSVEFAPGIVMTNFRSKSLNRTFDTIIFSSGVAGPK